MITVYGRNTSSNVQIVMWALGELGLAHERLDVGGQYGGTDTPEFLAMNPMGLVPVLRDGDTTIFESAAILRYLGAAYGPEAFWPKDPAARARLDQWAEWAKNSVAGLFTMEIFWQLVRTPEPERDLARVDRAARRLGELMRIADRRLADRAYLGGEALAFPDIVLGSVLHRYHALEFPKPQLPNLDAYHARLTDRPAYAEHVMVSFESLRPKPPSRGG